MGLNRDDRRDESGAAEICSVLQQPRGRGNEGDFTGRIATETGPRRSGRELVAPAMNGPTRRPA